MSSSDIQDNRYIPQQPLTIPALFIVGVKDDLCTEQHSKELAKRFTQATFVQHKSSHVIPSQADVRDAILQFISSHQ